VSGWEIADADPDDVGPLARIIGDWVRETGWMPVLHSREDDACFLAGLIATHAVRVVRNGAARLGFLARQAGQVQALHVAAASRGLGIGSALLNEVKAAEHEVSLWTFQANHRALAFYHREGFHEVARTDGRSNDEGLPDVQLIWRTVP